MRYDKLTVKGQEALQTADSLANSHHHAHIDVVHLLAALLEQQDGIIPPLTPLIPEIPSTAPPSTPCSDRRLLSRHRRGQGPYPRPLREPQSGGLSITY